MPHPAIRIAAGLVLAIPIGLLIWKLGGPARQPVLPRQIQEIKRFETAEKIRTDRLKADPAREIPTLTNLIAATNPARDFSYPSLVMAATGHSVIPLNESPAHQRLTAAIRSALETQPSATARQICQSLAAEQDIACAPPQTAHSLLQITHVPTNEIFYLKLAPASSPISPSQLASQIHHDAVHLSASPLTDLSSLRLTPSTTFQPTPKTSSH